MSSANKKLRLPCRYQRTWNDGFGARGWKLVKAINDPEIIAATAETGDRIDTSVFIHDVLDHALCGLGTSGHRNEAIALRQLAIRTGMDPRPDYAQIVDEDLMQGRSVGEPLRSLLSPELLAVLPPHAKDGPNVIERLSTRFGKTTLRERLISRLIEIGDEGAEDAQRYYCKQGLDYDRRTPLGHSLQSLLEQADTLVVEQGWQEANGEVWITKKHCGFQLHSPQQWSCQTAY